MAIVYYGLLVNVCVFLSICMRAAISARTQTHTCYHLLYTYIYTASVV